MGGRHLRPHAGGAAPRGRSGTPRRRPHPRDSRVMMMPDETPPTGTVHLLPGVANKLLLDLLGDIARERGWLIAPAARITGGDDVTLSEELYEFFASCKDKIDWLLEPYVFDGGFTIIQGAP